MPWLLDTNTVSLFARQRDGELCARVEAAADDCHISAVTWYELEYGVARRPDLRTLRIRLDLVRETFPDVEVFGEDAAFHAGAVRAALETRRPNATPIGPCDVLIAGHALSLGAVLVTDNVGEFSRVPQLRVENWRTLRL